MAFELKSKISWSSQRKTSSKWMKELNQSNKKPQQNFIKSPNSMKMS
jgi:hypothetical protein